MRLIVSRQFLSILIFFASTVMMATGQEGPEAEPPTRINKRHSY